MPTIVSLSGETVSGFHMFTKLPARFAYFSASAVLFRSFAT